MDLPTVVALGRGLLLAAMVAPRLPEAIVMMRRLVAARLDALVEAAGANLPMPEEARSAAALSGRRLDAAWSGLYSWLEGLAGLSADSSASGEAARALGVFFPEGRGLVRPPPLLEWAESEARFIRLNRGGLSATLRALGGGPFLEVLATAHQEHGEALEGFTGGAFLSRRLARAVDGLALALVAHVAVVSAELLDGEPESEALASVLLAPLEFITMYDEPPAPLSDPTLDSLPPSWESLPDVAAPPALIHRSAA